MVGDERDDGVDQKAPTIVYWPMYVKDFWSDPRFACSAAMAFAIRTNRAASAGFLKEIRQAVWSVNPDLPIAHVRTVAEIYDQSMARTSFTLVMLAIAGGDGAAARAWSGFTA